MGYVHTYGYQPGSDPFAAAWPAIVGDVQTIIAAVAEIGIAVCGPMGTGDPIADLSDGIMLNGDDAAGLSFDGFDLPAPHHTPGAPADCRVWRFVKTARRPYDLAVTAILLRAHLLAPEVFAIGSDGQWAEEWTTPPGVNPRDLVARLFGVHVADDPLADPSEGMAIGPTGWIDPRLVDNPVIP
ncbi:hypothetical protein HDA40_002130 [Hamadaea flava]|uniref:Uncharacterized protein n=1 Tax=Hamadaea flava TaxID=1742688 RepID=A0ABV8LLH7_9ACTN|nr:hypothetical protein [Hamadaea flava]MCP2323623.1 hypothetical protein [Hamadaea flava]